MKILFLCTGNSCRSQMAEGWAKQILPEHYEVFSAGTEPHGLNPWAIKSMAAAGVDISKHTSDHLDQYKEEQIDVIFTVCDHAAEQCPVVPGKVVHHSFEDPPALARGETNPDDILSHYNRVRDQIKEWVSTIAQTVPVDP